MDYAARDWGISHYGVKRAKEHVTLAMLIRKVSEFAVLRRATNRRTVAVG